MTEIIGYRRRGLALAPKVSRDGRLGRCSDIDDEREMRRHSLAKKGTDYAMNASLQARRNGRLGSSRAAERSSRKGMEQTLQSV
jgi:hypothetical protein